MSDDINLLVKAIQDLAARIDLLEQRIGSGGSDKKRTVWELTKIIEAKEKEAQKVKDGFSSDSPFGPQWSDESFRQDYIKLRKEIRSLNKEMASLA